MEMLLAILLVSLAAGWSWYSSQEDDEETDESDGPADGADDTSGGGDLLDPVDEDPDPEEPDETPEDPDPVDPAPDEPEPEDPEPEPDPVFMDVDISAGGSFTATSDVETFELNLNAWNSVTAEITGFETGIDMIALLIPAVPGENPPTDGSWRPGGLIISSTPDEVTISFEGAVLVRLLGIAALPNDDLIIAPA